MKGRNRQVSPDEVARQQQQKVAAESGSRVAAAQATEQDPMADMDQTDFMEALRDADITSDEFEELESILKPHLSGTLVTAYFDEDDRQGMKAHNMALTHRVMKERDSGRLCTGPFLEHAQGVTEGDSVKAAFKPHQRRAVKSALEEVRYAMQTLGIDHTGLDKTADTTVETRVQNMDDGGNKSRLGKAADKVFG